MDIKKMTKPIKNGVQSETEFPKEIQIAEKHLKKCSMSFIFKTMQTKSTLSFHLVLIRITTINETNNTSCCWKFEEKENSFIARGNTIVFRLCGIKYDSFLVSLELISLKIQLSHSWIYTPRTLHPIPKNVLICVQFLY